MGPILTLAAIALLVGYGWRTMRREHTRVVKDLKKAKAGLDKKAPLTLEQDPVTGVYRPSRDRD